MREIAKRVSLRLDRTEYAHLKQLSMDTGLKMEPVIRRLIVGAELRPRPPDELAELLRQLSGMAVNINQIAKQTNTEQEVGNAVLIALLDLQTTLDKALASSVFDDR